MKRRQAVRFIGAVGVTGWVSGCSATDGGQTATEEGSPTETNGTETAESGCGPGEQTIRELADSQPAEPRSPEAPEPTGTADDETVSITGATRSVADSSVVIDDGTGRAKLTTLFGSFEMENVAEGDCVAASGIPFAPEENSTNDIHLLVEEVGQADGQRTDAG